MRTVGAEHIGAPDVCRVSVEADLVGKRREDGVVAGERRHGGAAERTRRRAVSPGRGTASSSASRPRPSKVSSPAPRARPVRMREQHELGSLEREDAPALEEVAVVADRGPTPQKPRSTPATRTPAETGRTRRTTRAPFVAARSGRRGQERERVVVGATVKLAEAVADHDAALRARPPITWRSARPRAGRSGSPRGCRCGPMTEHFREDDEVAARRAAVSSNGSEMRLEVVLDLEGDGVDLRRRPPGSACTSAELRSVDDAGGDDDVVALVGGRDRADDAHDSAVPYARSSRASRSGRSRKWMRPTGSPGSTTLTEVDERLEEPRLRCEEVVVLARSP